MLSILQTSESLYRRITNTITNGEHQSTPNKQEQEFPLVRRNVQHRRREDDDHLVYTLSQVFDVDTPSFITNLCFLCRSEPLSSTLVSYVSSLVTGYLTHRPGLSAGNSPPNPGSFRTARLIVTRDSTTQFTISKPLMTTNNTIFIHMLSRHTKPIKPDLHYPQSIQYQPIPCFDSDIDTLSISRTSIFMYCSQLCQTKVLPRAATSNQSFDQSVPDQGTFSQLLLV